jgi:hypothetical protein
MKLALAEILTCSCIAVTFFGARALADPSDLSETEVRAKQAHASIGACLTKESNQLGNELGVVDLLTRLQRLDEHEKHKRGIPLSPESITLRLEAREILCTTMLQCQAVIAQIESDTLETLEIKTALENRRDSSQKTNSKANIWANGVLSGLGQTLQIPFETAPDSRAEYSGEVTSATADFAAVGLGYLALHQSKGIALNGYVRPNMLAKIFMRPNDARTEYPDSIWRYLNSVPPGSKSNQARRQLLIDRWVELGRIQPLNTEKGRQYSRELAGTVLQPNAVNVDMLEDRVAMLADVRVEVSQIYKELLNMMLLLRAL